jgi:hypothetical protein
MFQGTLPADALSVIEPVVRGWGCTDLAFPCSGKFTVPRSLTELGAGLHGNDVTLYSCAIGEFYSGGDLCLKARPGLGLEWLDSYLGTTLDRVAAVLVFSEFAEAWVKRDKSKYHRRLADAARSQFSRMQAKTAKKLAEPTWQLASFTAGDCVDFVGLLPEQYGVITFPPVYKSGYERMFRCLHECFDWQPPSYQIFDGDRLKAYLELVTARPYWIYGAQEPVDHPALEGKFLCKVRVTNRSPVFYLYASQFRGTRLVEPHQDTEPLMLPKLSAGEPVGGDLGLVPLSSAQFSVLRSQYLDPAIPPGSPMVRLGVLAGGKLIGAVAFDRCKFQLAGADAPSIYLLSDFSVGTAPRLSKLVAAAALSRECQLLLERQFGRRLRSVVTTAFSDNPVSMKYRGYYKLLCRSDAEPGDPHRFKLSYAGQLGGRSLAEIRTSWEKHAVASPH